MTHENRILDASAMIALFNGRPSLMRLLDVAGIGGVFLLMPTTAVAMAESALMAGSGLWRPFLLCHGVLTMDLTVYTAIEAAHLAESSAPVSVPGPLMVGQVVFEAQILKASIVTDLPDLYRHHEDTLIPVEP